MSNNIFFLPCVWKWLRFILRGSLLYVKLFFFWISENSQILISEHIFEIFKDSLFYPNVWKWPHSSLKIILLRFPRTYFFHLVSENVQNIFSENHFRYPSIYSFTQDIKMARLLPWSTILRFHINQILIWSSVNG